MPPAEALFRSAIVAIPPPRKVAPEISSFSEEFKAFFFRASRPLTCGRRTMQTYLEIPVSALHLAACLHRPDLAARNTPTPVVVCCHGLTGTRVGTAYRMVRLARMLEAEGIACLRFDFRGCGESDGRFEDLTIATLQDDLRAVVTHLASLDDCDPSRIGIFASSFGAYTASHVSPDIHGLRCLAFLAPVSSAKALIDRDMTPEAWDILNRRGWIEHHGLKLGKGFFECHDGEGAPAALARAKCPTLIFHGKGDRQVPISHSRAYEAALQSAGIEVRLETIEADDHALRHVATSDRILSDTMAWFKQYL